MVWHHYRKRLGDADSLIRGGFKFTTWLPSQSSSNMLIQYSGAEKWLHSAACWNSEWKMIISYKGLCSHSSPSFLDHTHLLLLRPISSPFSGQQRGGCVQVFTVSYELLRGFQRMLETLGAYFYHPRVSGTIPAMFVNHLVPKYNSLSISVNKTGHSFCQV